MGKDFYNLQEIAELLNMNLQTIRKYVRAGELKASKIGKQYIVTKENLKAFIDSKQIN